MFKILLGATAILTILLGSLSWYTKNLYADYTTEKNNNVILEAAKLELEKKVKKVNEISKGFQKQLSLVDRQLASIRMRNSKTVNCITLDTGERGPDGTGTGKIIFDGNGRGGLSVDWLYDFAGRCERTRQKTIGLQNFVRAVND